jgi:hypothetical protein
MGRIEACALVDSLWAAYAELVETAGGLSNEQLDTQVAGFGGRSTTLRNMVYQAVYQPLEHTIHITKLLQVTGASGAEPTEAQLMLKAAAETLGAFTGLYARIADEDIENSFEDQTPRRVAEHVRSSIQGAGRRVREALEAPNS